MGKLKQFLKKIFPIPTAGFMREMNRINDGLERNSVKLETINIQIDKLRRELTELDSRAGFEEINLKTDKLYKELTELDARVELLQGEPKRVIDSVVRHLNPDCRMNIFRREFERNFYKNTFNLSVFESPDYEKRVLALVRGLDEESVYIVSRNLFMLREIMSFKGEKMNTLLYNQEEQRAINNDVNRFNKSIIKLSDTLFYWNGYLLPKNHFEYCVFATRYGLSRVNNIEAVRNKHIIDAGAFIGDTALIFSPLTDEKVHCFEPCMANYEMLNKTVELNEVHNVVANHLALGSGEYDKIVLNTGVNTACSSIGVNDAMEYFQTEETAVISLDEYVKKNNLAVGMIKADLEGAEQDFIKGAMNTILEQKPILLISIYHNSSDFFDIKPMLEKLNLGYKFKVYRPTIASVLVETVLIAEVSGE